MPDSRNRPHRFATRGLINEPGFQMASELDQYGLWLDVATGPAAANINEKIYGRSSGVMPFPQPAI